MLREKTNDIKTLIAMSSLLCYSFVCCLLDGELHEGGVPQGAGNDDCGKMLGEQSVKPSPCHAAHHGGHDEYEVERWQMN